MKFRKSFVAVVVASVLLTGCATLTEDAMTPIAVSLSNGKNADCVFQNKRGIWEAEIAATIIVRKSDDPLKYECKLKNGKEAVGMIPSTMGAKIVASAVFLDFGIVDSITDKHRKYPSNFVIPVKN